MAKRDGRKDRDTRDTSLVEHVRQLIREDLVQCRLPPGQMVQLATLTERYGTSRTPVREALTQLERQGLVQAVPYKGYLVQPINVPDVHDIFFMRRLIEGAGAELAAKRIGKDDLQRLRRLRPPKAAIMTLEYDRYAHSFHRIVAAASGSPRLGEAFDNLYDNARRLMFAGIGNPRPDLIAEEHGDICEALAARDPDEARARMESHITAIQRRALGMEVFSSTDGD